MTQSPSDHARGAPFAALLRAVRRIGQPRYRTEIDAPATKLKPIEEVVATAGREAPPLAD